MIRAGFMLYETLLQANSVQQVGNNPPYSAFAVTRTPSAFPATGLAATLLYLRARPTVARHRGGRLLRLPQPLFDNSTLECSVASDRAGSRRSPTWDRAASTCRCSSTPIKCPPLPGLRRHHIKPQRRVVHVSPWPAQDRTPLYERPEPACLLHLREIHRQCERLRIERRFRTRAGFLEPRDSTRRVEL